MVADAIQIAGRHRGEWPVLQLAHAFEQAPVSENEGQAYP